jgi:hypothetical protein
MDGLQQMFFADTFMQDKYILGSLIIQFCICVWHAVASIINDNTLPLPPEATTLATLTTVAARFNVTRSPLTTRAFVSNATTAATAAATDVATRTAVVADYIACGTLGGIYITFQIVFLALIGTNVSMTQSSLCECKFKCNH